MLQQGMTLSCVAGLPGSSGTGWWQHTLAPAAACRAQACWLHLPHFCFLAAGCCIQSCLCARQAMPLPFARRGELHGVTSSLRYALPWTDNAVSGPCAAGLACPASSRGSSKLSRPTSFGTWFSGSWDNMGLASKFAATERRHNSCGQTRAQHQEHVPDCIHVSIDMSAWRAKAWQCSP